MNLYTVKRGDTLYSIADQFGTSFPALATANQIAEPSKLVAGQALIIPSSSPSPSRSIIVNGYALPSIGDVALNGALPYLTYLSIFAYRARMDGSLVPVIDESLIRRAYASNVAPMMVLTNQREDGGFSSDIGHAILTDPVAQRALISNVAAKLSEKNYYGLNVDFEYLYETDREAYVEFLTRLAARLKPIGYVLGVALAPKTSAEQTGLLYTAHDYAAIGAIVDLVILMTYEWGYTYGPPMAVAPIDQVERVLQYAVTAIPSEKILMGMPNYGYNWKLPYTQGRAAQAVQLAEAPRLAYQQYANILYDATANAPFFRYYDSAGTEHIVWFDDVRSISARLALIEKYDLGGVSYWNINTLFRPNWIVLSEMYRVTKVF